MMMTLTVRKWRGFVDRWGGSRFIVGNVFAYRSTDVRQLATVEDAFGDLIGDHTTSIITEADILVAVLGQHVQGSTVAAICI